MKFTFSWLKEFLETTASVDEICEKLTSIGIEVEGVEDKAKLLSQFEVAKILEAEKHPNADRLKYCKVETTSGILNVVCGAANARAGLKVVLARVGHTIPGSGIVLKKSDIRGVPSEGMMCSEEELGLPETIDGIMELPEDAPLGANFAEYMGYNDPVIEVAITPNRGDCFGLYGIARDLAAAGIGRLVASGQWPVTSENNSANCELRTANSPIGVTITDKDCYLFIGRYFSGVKNGESPAWLKRKLEAVGLRPISALVDITNYFTIAYGRPLHVFDADKLSGNITVRESRAGEKLLALNDKEYELPAGYTVVADDNKPQGIGGIIGGEESGCSMETKNVFLEVAIFSSSKVAREGRDLELSTDARQRFERGVDPEFARVGAELASRMIVELCGGTASEFVIAGKTPEWKRTIKFRPEYVKKLGGVEVPIVEIERILSALGFAIETPSPLTGEGWGEGETFTAPPPHPNPLPQRGEGILTVQPPSWRPDIEGEADVVEEVLRIYGYDKIPVVIPYDEAAGSAGVVASSFSKATVVKKTLASRGLLDAVTFSFMKSSDATDYSEIKPALKLLKPISEELDYLRPTLVPNLLAAAKRNSAVGAKSGAIFEVGSQFDGITPKQQRQVVAGVRYGEAVSKNVYEKSRTADTFDAKADALAVLEALGLKADKLEVKTESPKWYHPGKSASLMLGGKIPVAVFGELHPAILKKFELKSAVAFEVYLDLVPDTKAKGKSTKTALKISEFPLVDRDFAFVVDEKVSAGDIIKAAVSADKEFIKSAKVFDVFVGKDLPSGKKSVAVSVIIEPKDKTLTDAEINAIMAKVTEAVTKATGAAIRGGEQKAA